MKIYYLSLLFLFTNKIYSKDIILVHGFKSNADIWENFVKYFSSKEKYYNIFLFDYRNTTTENINYNSEELMKFVISQNISKTSSIFIGHSMGGIVIRQMLSLYPEFCFSKIITLGTPHYGSSLIICYPFCIWESLNQLYYNSLFMKNLNSIKNLEKFNKENFLSYSISEDLIVDIKKSFINRGINLIANKYNIEYINNNTDTILYFIGEFNEGIKIHLMMINIPEILLNVYKFIENKFIFLQESPIVYAKCIFIDKEENIKWVIPENSPDSLVVNIISINNTDTFISVPINNSVRLFNINNDTFCINFFNPETSTISECTFLNLKYENDNCEFDNIFVEFPLKNWKIDNSEKIIEKNNYILFFSILFYFFVINVENL